MSRNPFAVKSWQFRDYEKQVFRKSLVVLKSDVKQTILGRPYSEEAFFGSFFGRLQKMNNQG